MVIKLNSQLNRNYRNSIITNTCDTFVIWKRRMIIMKCFAKLCKNMTYDLISNNNDDNFK